jgi:hypothetical protein
MDTRVRTDPVPSGWHGRRVRVVRARPRTRPPALASPGALVKPDDRTRWDELSKEATADPVAGKGHGRLVRVVRARTRTPVLASPVALVKPDDRRCDELSKEAVADQVASSPRSRLIVVVRARTRAPVPASPVALVKPEARRWDHLSQEARASWSREISQREALAQGLPSFASAAQHHAIGRILSADAARLQRGIDRGLSRSAARGHPRTDEPTAPVLERVEREAAGGKKASLDDWRQAVEVRAREEIGSSRRDAADLRECLKKADRQTLRQTYQASPEDSSRHAKEARHRGLERSPFWYK